MGERKSNFKYILVIVFVCLLSCGTLGISNTYGLFYDSMGQILNATKATVTFHMTISKLANGLMMPVVAILYEKIGTRKTITLGCFMYFVSGLVIAYSMSPMLNNFMGFFRGFGMSCTTNLAITLTINKWFKSSRGKITGLAYASSGIGGVFLTKVIEKVLVRYGFRVSYITSLVLVALAVLPLALFISETPEEEGLKPYSNGKQEKKKIFDDTGKEVFKYMSLNFVLFILMAILTNTVPHMVSHFASYATNIGYDLSVGANLTSISMVGNALSKIILGFIVDKTNGFFSMGLAQMIGVISAVLIVAFPQSTNVMYIATLFYGFSLAANTVGMSSLIQEIYVQDSFSKVYSKTNLALHTSGALYLIITSKLFDHFGSFTLAFYLLALGELLAFFITLIVYFKSKKKNV